MDIIAIIIEEKENIGSGLHGDAIKKGNKVYKITNSKHEYNLAKNILESNYEFKALPKIYGTRDLNNGKYLIIREYYNDISDDIKDLLAENEDEIFDYFYSKIIDIRKSQTNLDYYFDNKILDYLQNLKYEIIKVLKLNWNGFDLDGIVINTGIDKNGNYRLFDF